MLFHQRHGRSLRVATKFSRLTRAFFADSGIIEYSLVESSGATEGAPASGVADFVVDLTSTGTTLAENHLKEISGGTVLQTEAVSDRVTAQRAVGSQGYRRVRAPRRADRGAHSRDLAARASLLHSEQGLGKRQAATDGKIRLRSQRRGATAPRRRRPRAAPSWSPIASAQNCTALLSSSSRRARPASSSIAASSFSRDRHRPSRRSDRH